MVIWRVSMKLSFIKPAYAHCDCRAALRSSAGAHRGAERARNYEQVRGLAQQEDKWRAVLSKKNALSSVKHHLWCCGRLLQTRAPRSHPNLHDLFLASDQAGRQLQKERRPSRRPKLLDLIDQIAEISGQRRGVASGWMCEDS